MPVGCSNDLADQVLKTLRVGVGLPRDADNADEHRGLVILAG